MMMMKTKKQRKARDHGQARPIIGDPRFARLHSDPRFQRGAKSKTKVPIDSRFRHMFWDKNFLDPLGLDKRGRRTKKKDRQTLNRYYKVDEEQVGSLVEQSEKEDNGIVPEKERSSIGSDRTKKDEVLGGILFNGRNKISGAVSKSEAKAPGKSKQQVRVSDFDVESDGKNSEDSSPDNCHTMVIKGAFSKGMIRTEGNDSQQSEEESEEELPYSLINDSRPAVDSGLENSILERKFSDLGSTSSSEESDNLDSDSSSISDDDSQSLTEEESDHEEEKISTTEKETKRLALINMDWNNIKAVDLLLVMKSFLPKGGHIEFVAVYPSKFGLQQMKDEEKHGPKGIFEPNNEGQDFDEEDEIDMEKLREYEKAKLRYYFAVVTCDSCETASSLYTSCDGIEFERTSNVLDMRFIPDDMDFDVAPRDTATEVSADYKPPEFETRALQHSNVKLTWDDEEPVRVKALRKKFNSEQLNDMDFKTYLASEDDSDSDHGDGLELLEEENEMKSATTDTNKSEYSNRNLRREAYRSLLLGSEESYVNKNSQKNDLDMEITFCSGLSELSKRLVQKSESKHNEGETVWEAYLRKKKEKKKARKKEQISDSGGENVTEQSEEEREGEGEGDAFFQHDENGFNDPFFNSGEENIHSVAEAESIDSKRRATKATTSDSKSHEKEGGSDWASKRRELQKKREEEGRSKAELELLLMDDHSLQNGIKGFNLKVKKLKGKKKLKGGKFTDKEDKQVELCATADYDDPRFSSIFTSHHFAIDPTDPQYARFSSQLRSGADKQHAKLNERRSLEQIANHQETVQESKNQEGDKRKRKSELSSLVSSLKRKVGVKQAKKLQTF